MSARPSLKTLSTRKAGLTSRYGAADPRTLAAGRELAAAKVLAALATGRADGLDNLDMQALVLTGRLPPSVTVGKVA